MTDRKRGWDGRSAGCDRVFQEPGEPLRAFGCAGGTPGGHGSRDRDEFAPDGGSQSVDPASHEWIEPLDRDVQPAERLRAFVALPPMPVERDHLTHGDTVPAGSDTGGRRAQATRTLV